MTKNSFQRWRWQLPGQRMLLQHPLSNLGRNKKCALFGASFRDGTGVVKNRYVIPVMHFHKRAGKDATPARRRTPRSWPTALPTHPIAGWRGALSPDGVRAPGGGTVPFGATICGPTFQENFSQATTQRWYVSCTQAPPQP